MAPDHFTSVAADSQRRLAAREAAARPVHEASRYETTGSGSSYLARLAPALEVDVRGLYPQHLNFGGGSGTDWTGRNCH
ncbi:MAG: hypothetical protein JNK82_29740 [Myxococcaceae bacterium]|nr:hypothetical protein [Myxococcaceae bacterium]